MRGRTWRPALLGAAIAVTAGLAAPGLAKPGAITLGPTVRIQTPGSNPTTCPVEGEPTVTVTSAGTWVAYNDDQGCPLNPVAKLHLTSVQLVPARGGAPRYVQITAHGGGYLSGDPALAPDPHHPGAVLLANLESLSSGNIDVTVYRISPALTATPLPSPHVGGTFDDKEFMASDLSSVSRFRGRTYVAWDQTDGTRPGVIVRAFDGRKWLAPVRVFDNSGFPDIAVAPNGNLAVAWVGSDGSYVAVSTDGGRSFSHGVRAIAGGDPGRLDPACPLRPTVGIRQRVLGEPRLAYDAHNVLHVVTSLNPAPPLTGRPAGAAATGGTAVILHATSTTGYYFPPATPVATVSGVEQFDPAIARTPQGGVAVEWLQTAGSPELYYDSYLSVLQPGARAFTAPVKLSTGTSMFPSAMEALGNSDCYGIGDYTGLTTTRDGVVATWPTTDKAATPQFDTDVLVRPAVLR
jgi:hypothetical protein